MKLYKIEIASYLDDTTKTVLVMSYEELTKESSIVKSFAVPDYTYIYSCTEAEIFVNAWDSQEYEDIKSVVKNFQKFVQCIN